MHAARIGEDIFRVSASRRSEHAVAGLDAGHVAADSLDFTGAFKTERRAAAARGGQ